MPGEIPMPSPVEAAPVEAVIPAQDLSDLHVGETIKRPTVAESLGLTDGMFTVTRPKSALNELERTDDQDPTAESHSDTGWFIKGKGFVHDAEGNRVEAVKIEKPLADANGTVTGYLETAVTVSDLMQWNAPTAEASPASSSDAVEGTSKTLDEVENGGAQEIEGASPEAVDVGTAALSTEVAVDAASIPPDVVSEKAAVEGTSLVEVRQAQEMIRALPERFGSVGTAIATLKNEIESGITNFETSQTKSLRKVGQFVSQARQLSSTLMQADGLLRSLNGDVYSPVGAAEVQEVQRIFGQLDALVQTMQSVDRTMGEAVGEGNAAQSSLGNTLGSAADSISTQLERFRQGAQEIGAKVITGDQERSDKKANDPSYTEVEQEADRNHIDTTHYVSTEAARRTDAITDDLSDVTKIIRSTLNPGSHALTSEVLSAAGLNRTAVTEVTTNLQTVLTKMRNLTSGQGTKGNLLAELGPMMNMNGQLAAAVNDIMRMRVPEVGNSEQPRLFSRIRQRTTELAQVADSTQDFLTAMAA